MLSLFIAVSVLYLCASLLPTICSVVEYDNYSDVDKVSCGLPATQFPILSRFSSVWRIVGGKEANRHSLPWQVMVSTQNNSQRFECGGTIISEEWIMTAAHCFQYGAPQNVIAGVHALDEERAEGNSRQWRKVAESFVHPGYATDYNNDPWNEYKDFDNDIALLYLVPPLQLNDYVKPVCLPQKKAPDQTMCMVSGWGLKEGKVDAVRLQQVYVPLMNWEECVDILGRQDFTENMICAGVPYEGKDACDGDSGGPLLCQDPDSGQWQLQGVVSWGFNCGEEPGAYTDVPRYYSWVHQMMKEKEIQGTSSVASSNRVNSLSTTKRPEHGALTSNGPIVSILVGEHLTIMFVAMVMTSHELYV